MLPSARIGCEHQHTTAYPSLTLRRGIMEQIGRLLSGKDRNIRFDGGDLLTRKGYTLVPNFLLDNDRLSSGAKLAYVMLLKYAWEKNFSYPGQVRLAADMGVSERYARNCLKELEQQRYISIQRRGQGRSNVYTLHLRVEKRNT